MPVFLSVKGRWFEKSPPFPSHICYQISWLLAQFTIIIMEDVWRLFVMEILKSSPLLEGLVIPSAPEWCHHIHNIKINIIKMLIKFFTRVPVVKLLYYNCHKPLFGSWSRHFSEFCGGWVLVQLKIFIICPPTPSLRLTFAEGSTLIGPDLTKNWALIGGTSLCKMYKNLCIKNYVLATRDILSLSLWQWKNIFYISSHQDTV